MCRSGGMGIRIGIITGSGTTGAAATVRSDDASDQHCHAALVAARLHRSHHSCDSQISIGHALNGHHSHGHSWDTSNTYALRSGEGRTAAW